MLDNFAASFRDGTVLRSAPGAVLGVGRLITTTQQARDDRAAPETGICAVVDGRLDDLDTLRGALDIASDASDADLIVAGYRRWGPGVVEHLHGEFALLLWDEGASTLFAARDRFGVRPLCYSQRSGRLILASDPEQIVAAGLVAPEPDDRTVVGHLLWEYQDVERTFFRDIRRLPAGHVLIATADRLRVTEYRRPQLVDVGADPGVWQELRRRFFVSGSGDWSQWGRAYCT